MNKAYRATTILFVIFFGVISFLGLSLSVVHAGESATGLGWIWSGSENPGGDIAGFGWVSANSLNCDTDDNGLSDGGAGCPSIGTTIADYGIRIPQTTDPDQTLGGHAWSERMGWISFEQGDLSGCPSGTCNARRVGDELHGWARILALPDGVPNDGGFSGWIKLHSESGDPISYGVALDESVLPKEVSGYAWSDEFGWLDFSRMLVGPIPDLIICPSSFTIVPDASLQLRLYIGSKFGRAACANLTNMTEITTDALSSWLSADSAIASVDNAGQKGLVQAITPGITVVTASYKGLTANAYITVSGTSNANCGNGHVDPGEECDEGANANGACSTGATCSPSCTLNVCTCLVP